MLHCSQGSACHGRFFVPSVSNAVVDHVYYIGFSVALAAAHDLLI